MKFAEVLKEERSQLGLNQVEFAKIFNVTKQTVSNWENGNRTPDSTTLSKLADYFGVTVDYLLGRTKIRNFNIEEKPTLDEGIKTIAAYKINPNLDLPDDAIEKINDFIRMVELDYKNKDK